MVEHRPWNDIIAYAILTLGVFIVAFPVYLALVASTHDAATVVGGHMPATPGSHTLENYYRAIFVGGSRTSREPVGQHADQFVCLGDRHCASARFSSRSCRPMPWCISAFRSARRRSGSSLSR